MGDASDSNFYNTLFGMNPSLIRMVMEKLISSSLLPSWAITIRHSTSKLLNDLVVEEAYQWNIVRELQAQSKNIDHSLL